MTRPESSGLESRAEASTGQEAERAPRRRRRRRRGGSASGKDAADSQAPAEGAAREPQAAGGEPEGGEEAPKRKRRSRRGGRGRRAKAGSSEAGGTETADADASAEAPDSGDGTQAPKPEKKRRRRGGRGGRKSRSRAAGPVELEVIPGEEDEIDPDAVAEDDDGDEGGEQGGRKKRSRRKRSGSGSRKDQASGDGASSSGRSERTKKKAAAANNILVNAADREETRVAVVEDGVITDFQMTVKRHNSLVNDIYRGKVVNLEPAIGAAFIDFGQGRNGFLHTSDVLSAYGDDDWSLDKLLTTPVDADEWDAAEDAAAEDAAGDEEGAEDKGADDEEPEAAKPKRRERKGRKSARSSSRHRARPRLPITDLLKKGQSVVVQVTKEAIGDKGPTLTTYISIPGRYLVLMPSMARTGVSRKIDDEKERKRLKRILEGLEIPTGMGVIVRTAGTGCTKADIKRDLEYLLLLWDSFGKRLNLGRGPAPLYEESDVAIRTIRDLFNDATESVIVDDPKVYERVRNFTEKLMPENLDRIKLHDGKRPLFHTYGVEQDFERIFARRIDLPSGGSIVLDQTEALVAIDVNSGKTRSDGFDFEEIALKTNLDAVPEIARQIRLRDLGGIVVVDFIDMRGNSNRRVVERALRTALSTDRARSKLGRISQFGLLELTRQRLGPGLSKMLFQNCSRCRGSGRVRTVESRTGALLRRLGSALTLKGFSKVEVRTQGEVVEYLQRNFAGELRELESKHDRQITLAEAPDQVEDCVLRYLRADGREVRPGGRRKR